MVNSRKRNKNNTEKTRKLGMALVVIAIVALALAVVMAYFNQPEKQISQKLETLATDYYENYYYNQLMDVHSEAAELAEFAETGLPTVKLRQLLLYDTEKTAADGDFLAKYDCDTNQTGVKFFPVEPYGQKDYRVEYTIKCDY